jgi:signal transduction histidine kinase
VNSRPSTLVRGFLNRRALLGTLGGLAVLAALALAVRQTTKPLLNLSRNIRTFAGKLDAPALPVEGSREMRDLAEAYNEMKERIAGLIGERTRILAAVAHDMRTYLTRLRLRIEFINDPEQQTRAAADLGEMSALLDDTLLFANTENAAPPLERIDLAAELNRIVAARKELGESVSLQRMSSPLPVCANRLSLRRMLANLIDNGLRHGQGVEITAAILPDGAAIEVRDDGPGVPPEALSRLGMPFQRLDPSRDRETGGAGLGLAIVRALAARQGAQVSFANRKPHGFAARIVFPLAANGDADA